MTNFFNTLPYRITGDNPATLAKYDVNSRKKIIQLGYMALLPVIIWFITGFLTSYNVLGSSLFVSLLVAIFCAGIVFMVERTIVMSNRISKFGVVSRSILGVLIALIGSSMLDLIIYQDDIDFKIKSELLAKNKEDLDIKSELVNAKTAELHNEMFGKGGTGMKGYHKASRSIEDQLNDMKKQRDNASENFDSIKKVISDPNHAQYETMKGMQGMNTIVYRHEKLFEILKSSNYEIAFYCFILFISIILEVLPLIIKKSLKDTAYELDLAAQEVLLENRRKKILDKSANFTSMNQYQREVYDTFKQNNKFSLLNK